MDDYADIYYVDTRNAEPRDYLHADGAPLPDPALWRGLLAQLCKPALRNSGPSDDGPFKHFEATSYSDLYIEQFKYLRDLRGSDLMEPEPGMKGGDKVIPRSTNAEVIALADYWSKQLDGIKHVIGHDNAVARWKAALVDVDAIARKGDLQCIYVVLLGYVEDRRVGERVARDALATPEIVEIEPGTCRGVGDSAGSIEP